MTQETATYLTNIGISVILAGLLSHSWASQGRPVSMRCWMIAAWIMVLTNCLFAARPELPRWFGRLAPTLFVTLAHGVILLGARAIAGRPGRWKTAVGVTLLHGIVLVYFLMLEERSHWRMVSNGMVWAGLSIAAFFAFRRGPVYFWRSVFSPANVLMLHALFHLVRVTLSILSSRFGWERVAGGLQLFGDLEASVFIVALYVSILVSTMRQHFDELANTRGHVRRLSGLLPVCAWCKKVRDDAGYWQQVDDYLRDHTDLMVTHGICSTCEAERFPRDGRGKRPAGSPEDAGPRGS